MLTFLPALILLLLHGPANMEGRLARAGERADVGSRLPAVAPVPTRSSRTFLAELLRRFPGATVLAALADEPITASERASLEVAQGSLEPIQPDSFSPPASSQRDRDGPFLA